MSYTSGVTAISGLNAVSAAASATVSVTASSDTSDGTRVNVVYTVMVTSDTTDPAGIQIDELVDTHDAGSQYVSSSTSTKLGSVSYAAAPDPQSLAADSAKSPPPMHFIGPYTGIKSGTPQYLKYKFSVPCDGTVYKNTVVAYLGDVLIGKSASAASAISVSASSGSGACGSVSVQTTTTSLDPTATTQPAANVARLFPGFEPSFGWIAFIAALAATAVWVWLVMWRTAKHRHALWKSLVLPAGGAALCWLLLLTLWLPLLDFARSYKPWVQQIQGVMAKQDAREAQDVCLLSYGLDVGQMTAFHYHGGFEVKPADMTSVDQQRACPWLVVDNDLRPELAQVVQLNEWQRVRSIYRPADKKENVTLYHRRQP